MSYELLFNYQNRQNHTVVLSIVFTEWRSKALKLERKEMPNCGMGLFWDKQAMWLEMDIKNLWFKIVHLLKTAKWCK